MMQADAAVVRREIVVKAPIEKAFTVFTDRFGDFKPREHNLLRAPIVETVFEPRVGGNIVDRGEDGSECRWARILAYDPPHRVVFSWDIGPTWQIESDPDLTSETWGVRGIDGPIRAIVDVTVASLGADRSQLTISVDFTGHGIGKVLVPLVVRREAAKEMPANLAALKQRLERQP